MDLYTCRIAGRAVDPASVAPPSLHFGRRTVATWSELPYELAFELTDLSERFAELYAGWIEDMQHFPDPDDELEVVLHHLDWPSLSKLGRVEPSVLAAVLLCFGYDILIDLEHSRDTSVPIEFAPNSVDEVELRGSSSIILRGRALLVHYEVQRPLLA